MSTPRLLGDPPIYPQVLAVCHQVYDEARPVLYGCNTFLAHPNLLAGMPRLRLYYDTISKASLISLIQRFHIRVRLDCDPNFSAKGAAESFTGVKELTVEVTQAQFGSSDYKVLRLFEDVRAVEQARVYGSVSAFPAYVGWLQSSMMTPEGQHVDVFGSETVDLPVRPYDVWTVSAKER